MSTTGRQYGGRSQEDRRDERRQRLLAAGLELIGQEGVAALSVRGVSTRAGLTPRYFYEEFGSTDELARQLFDREFDASIARVGVAVAAAGPEILERVSAAVGAVLDVITEVPERAALLLTEASGTGVLAKRRRERMDDVVAVVAAFGYGSYGQENPPLTPAAELEAQRAVRSAAAFVAGGLTHTIDEWLSGRVERSRDVLQQDLAAQIVAVGDASFAQLQQATRRARSVDSGAAEGRTPATKRAAS